MRLDNETILKRGQLGSRLHVLNKEMKPGAILFRRLSVRETRAFIGYI